jgi:hypothetical protein
VAPTGRPVSRVLQIVEFDRAAPVREDVDAAGEQTDDTDLPFVI